MTAGGRNIFGIPHSPGWIVISTVVLLLAAAPAVHLAQAQSEPSISIELSPSNFVPMDTAITGTITLRNLDPAAYSSVIFRADITPYNLAERRCNGDDTGMDIEVAVDSSAETFAVRIYDSCPSEYFSYGTYTLDLAIYRLNDTTPGGRVELATTQTQFGMSRYLTVGEVIAAPPTPGAVAWMSPDPTMLGMRALGEWQYFRFHSDITQYLNDHMGVLMYSTELGHFADAGGRSGSPPSKSPADACQRAADENLHWRRAIHQGLWVVACKAGDATIRLTHETEVVAPLYEYRFATLPSNSSLTITGKVQVGETLAADTTGITDPDGLTTPGYTYQWLADDVAIANATASTYTLVAADEGKSIKVRVSFTDDGGNGESLTSAATAAVDPAANNPATGAPTISGTAQVGQTLTADTAGIADQGGLANADFDYQWLADGVAITGATDSTYTPVTADAGKAIKVRVSFTDDGGNGESLTSAATAAVAAAPNSAPIAIVATGPTVAGGGNVTLDGSDSYDPDGGALTYSWNQTSGALVSLSNSTAQKPTFTAPSAPDTLVFELTVYDRPPSDPGRLSASDTVTITVEAAGNRPPRADAGSDQTVSEGDTVRLRGSGSDRDGDSLTYSWEQASGPPVSLSSKTAASPTFTAPQVTSQTDLVFRLTVRDGTSSDTDTIRITVQNEVKGGSSDDGSGNGVDGIENNGSSQSSRGGGGGGGGGGAQEEIITDVRIYSVSWDCAARAVSAVVGPDTNQLTVRMRTSSAGEQPVERVDSSLPGSRAYAAAMSAADQFVIIEASLAYEGDRVITKIVNFRECSGSVTIDRHEPPAQDPAGGGSKQPGTELEQQQEVCRDGREPAVRDGSRLLCLFPGTFEILAERGWDLARP